MASKHDPHHEFIFNMLERGHSHVSIVRALLEEKGLPTTRSLLGKWIKVRQARIAKNTASLYPASQKILHSGPKEKTSSQSTTSPSVERQPTKVNAESPNVPLRKRGDFSKKTTVDFDVPTPDELKNELLVNSKIKL